MSAKRERTKNICDWLPICLCLLLFFANCSAQVNISVVGIGAGVQSSVEFDLNGFSITNFISGHGYPAEAHVNIETEDGYLLDMFRIPGGKNTIVAETDRKRPPVLLMHGLLGSAENWVISGPEKGLAFLLADDGYDVWLGNARGTVHSRKHVSLDANYDSDFWQFSWHEIGLYDLPAKIDYILQETNETSLSYVGHSQGTTAFFVMASERPNYNEVIKIMVALAPVAYLSNLPHAAIKLLSVFTRGANIFSDIIGINEFVPNNELLKLAGQAICQREIVIQEVCANILFLVAGYDSEQLDRSLIPLISQTTPAGASTKQFFHFGQGIRSGEFRKYDFGFLNNFNIYGSIAPPSYDLSSVSAPVALFYSSNDWLVSTSDVERLHNELSNVVKAHLVPYESFNHLDFLFAKDVIPLLYSDVINTINKFNK